MTPHSHIPPPASPLLTKLCSMAEDNTAITMQHADALFGILSAIARLSQDDTITQLAIHGKGLTQILHSDVDVYLDDVLTLSMEGQP